MARRLGVHAAARSGAVHPDAAGQWRAHVRDTRDSARRRRPRHRAAAWAAPAGDRRLDDPDRRRPPAAAPASAPPGDACAATRTSARGISKPRLLDGCAARARRRAGFKPDVTVMFLGANDGFDHALARRARARRAAARAWWRAYARARRGDDAQLPARRALARLLAHAAGAAAGRLRARCSRASTSRSGARHGASATARAVIDLVPVVHARPAVPPDDHLPRPDDRRPLSPTGSNRVAGRRCVSATVIGPPASTAARCAREAMLSGWRRPELPRGSCSSTGRRRARASVSLITALDGGTACLDGCVSCALDAARLARGPPTRRSAAERREVRPQAREHDVQRDAARRRR